MKNTGKIILLLALSMLLTVFVSCGDKEDDPNAPKTPNGFMLASNDIVDYYLFVPDDWVVDTAEGSLMSSARVNEHSTANVTMLSYDDGDGEYEDIAAYWESYKSTLEGAFDRVSDEEGNERSSFEMKGEGSTLKVDGVDAVKYIYTATLGGKDFQYVQLIAKKGNMIYILTYTTTPDAYDADTADSIINNIKFK